MRLWTFTLLLALTGCASLKTATPPAGSVFIASVDEVTLIPRWPGSACDATYHDSAPRTSIATCLSNHIGWQRAKLTTERTLFGPKVGKELSLTIRLTHWKARSLWLTKDKQPQVFGIVSSSAATDETEFSNYPLFTMPDGRLAFVPRLTDSHVFGLEVLPLLTAGSPPRPFEEVNKYVSLPIYARDIYLRLNLVSGTEKKGPEKYIKVIYLDDLVKALEAK